MMLAFALWLAFQHPTGDEIRDWIEQLGSESVEEREQAVRKLVSAGEAAVPHLRALEDDPDAERRSRIRAVLREIALLPGKKLAATAIPHHLLAFPDNWDRPLKESLDAHPDDPVAPFLKRGRAAIGELIPLLEDETETKHRITRFRSREEQPMVIQVRDYAMALIQYLSLCRFHANESSGNLFRHESDDARSAIARRVREWWKETAELSTEDGIRAQIPHAGYYGKVWMAESLCRLGREKKSGAEEDGKRVLRQIVELHKGARCSHAAEALLRYGDRSGFEAIYQRWAQSLETRGLMYDGGDGFLLLGHGGRHEWELITNLALKRLEEADIHSDTSAVNLLGIILGIAPGSDSPWAIPALAAALQPLGRGYDFHHRTLEALQKKIPKDFGYSPDASAEQRDAAVDKARAWWSDEGRNLFSFDRIQERLKDKR